MNPILLSLSYVFGLIPLNRFNRKSTNFFDYLVMLCIPFCYFGSYILANFSRFAVSKLPSCDSICRLGNQLFIHLGCFLYTTILFFTIIRRKTFFVQFNNSLKDIDEHIIACHKVADDKMKLPPNRHFYYFTWMLVVCIFGYAIFYDTIEMLQYYKEYFFVTIMAVTFPYFAGSIVQGQFIYYVSVISERFTELNYLLNKINLECDKKHAPIAVFDIECLADAKELQNNKSKFIGAEPLKEKSNQETDSTDENSDDDSDAEGVIRQPIGFVKDNTAVLKYDVDATAKSLRTAKLTQNDIVSNKYFINSHTSETNLPELFRLHDKILSLSVLTNAEFGPQCVPYMAACFVISIFGIFLETKVIFIVGGKNHLLDYVALIYVIWSLTTMVVAYLVLRLCCNANGYSKQSAMIVHEIMQKKPVFMLGNDLYYNKMKSFTLQFLHWEGYFQFNGIGLFALDYTFIFSTVSAATSYLIVLLQFDMSSILKNEGLT